MQAQSLGTGVNAVENVTLDRLREFSAQAARPLPLTPLAVTSPATDVSAALLNEIAQPDIARLTAFLEPARSSEVAARITDLSHDTALALTEGDRSRALANVTEMMRADPRAVEALGPDKLLEPIHTEVDHLLSHMTTVAKMDADGWLAQADEALETPGHASIPNWQTKPETLLHVAHQLFDSGGYTNYVRSADLAQAIVNLAPLAYSPFLNQYANVFAAKPASGQVRFEGDELLPKTALLFTVGKTLTAMRSAATPRLQTVWRRAPLLVLLLGWLVVGLVAGSAVILLHALWPETWPASLIDLAFNVWATGFLALVCFGFYARIRDIRS